LETNEGLHASRSRKSSSPRTEIGVNNRISTTDYKNPSLFEESSVRFDYFKVVVTTLQTVTRPLFSSAAVTQQLLTTGREHGLVPAPTLCIPGAGGKATSSYPVHTGGRRQSDTEFTKCLRFYVRSSCTYFVVLRRRENFAFRSLATGEQHVKTPFHVRVFKESLTHSLASALGGDEGPY
jgi:hypothetical protein